jgi:hypothetical protein
MTNDPRYVTQVGWLKIREAFQVVWAGVSSRVDTEGGWVKIYRVGPKLVRIDVKDDPAHPNWGLSAPDCQHISEHTSAIDNITQWCSNCGALGTEYPREGVRWSMPIWLERPTPRRRPVVTNNEAEVFGDASP